MCVCVCTVSSIQHAGAALSTAHAPDRRRQVHPGPSLLGSGGCHIWGDTVFWRRKENVRPKENNSQQTLLHMVSILGLCIVEVYLCVCGRVRRPTRRQLAEAGAVVGSWALHGRGWRKQTRMWRSFGRNGWSSNRGSAGSEPALRWEPPFCAVSPHPLMQKMCLKEKRKQNIFMIFAL